MRLVLRSVNGLTADRLTESAVLIGQCAQQRQHRYGFAATVADQGDGPSTNTCR